MMDDLNNISRDNSCILLKWKNKDKHNYRTNYNLSKYNQLKSNDSCSICGTNFTNECIIINTKWKVIFIIYIMLNMQINLINII